MKDETARLDKVNRKLSVIIEIVNYTTCELQVVIGNQYCNIGLFEEEPALLFV